MANIFENRTGSLSDPARDLVPVTPHDTNSLANVALSLYVETGGTLVVTTVQSHPATRTVKVSDFSILPCGVVSVQATGTTATGIHALIGN